MANKMLSDFYGCVKVDICTITHYFCAPIRQYSMLSPSLCLQQAVNSLL